MALGTSNSRRSTRVLVHIPIIVSGVHSRGQAVSAAGETEVVNKHGAKIHVLERLEKRMRIRVALPSPVEFATPPTPRTCPCRLIAPLPTAVP